MDDAIRTENLVKRFRKAEALRGLNLTVPKGAIYALVGSNGAGKTTTIKLLMNIFGATSGRAEVLGLDSRQIRGRHLASIGYVSENQQIPDWMRADSFLAFLRPFYPTWDRQLEDKLARQFDLPLDRRLRTLSRGTRMKAVLASALAFHPKLIVLDEPFTGLDPLVRDQLIQSLVERAAESTIFISSHDLGEIESFATHVGYLENGQLRLSEELTILLERFRSVEAVFDVVPTLNGDLPPSWMHVATADSAVRFIETRFNAEKTSSEIEQRLGKARNVTFSPMSLRSIFIAMAKSHGKPALEERS
jgi:ABC-2 type transport system ATP-binding protein